MTRPEPTDPAGAGHRTTLLLAGALTLSWTIIQLQSSLTTVTLKELAGPAVAGIGSTVFLASSALASVVGQDSFGVEINQALADVGVDASLVMPVANRPTTVKERFIGRAQNRHPHQMLRVDREVRDPLEPASGHQGDREPIRPDPPRAGHGRGTGGDHGDLE